MRNNDIINSSYVIGVGTRNMVLNTLGRLYVKVQDRYYEIDFRNQSNGSNSSPNIITINSANNIENLAYPGDDKLIISEDGKFWITKNNEFKQIEVNLNKDELTLNTLTINKQLVINPENEIISPIIINSKKLIDNLNAQYIDGYSSNDLAIKNKNENITNTWQFKDIKVFNTIKSFGEGLTLDFENDKISVCDLDVKCNITFPEDTFPKDNWNINNYGGLKNKTYFGREFKIDSFDLLSTYEKNILSLVETAYECKYLENDIELDDWYTVFFDLDPETYEWVIIDIDNNKNSANQKLISLGIKDKTIDDYEIVWKNLKDVPYSDHLGNFYKIVISDFVQIPFGTILPGNEFILNHDGLYAKAIELTNDGVIIKLKNEDVWLNFDTRIIQTHEDKSIYIQTDTPCLHVKNNNLTKVLIGNLKELNLPYSDEFGIYLNNPYIENNLIQINNNGGRITNSLIWDNTGNCYYKPNIIDESQFTSGTIDLTNRNIVSSTINVTSTTSLTLNVNTGTILELYVANTSSNDFTIYNVDSKISTIFSTSNRKESWLLLFVGKNKVFQISNENI